MVLRLGAVTGVGHARLILERFGRFWGAFSVIDLFLLNALTIVTEFIGITPRGSATSACRRPPRCVAGRGRSIIGCGVHRQLPPLRAVRHDALRCGSLLLVPVALMLHPPHRQMAHGLAGAAAAGRRGQLSDGDAADHRHRRHDGRALAAVLPAELRHRQADHPALHEVREGRPVDRHRGRGDRRGRDDGVRRRRRSPAPASSATSPTRPGVAHGLAAKYAARRPASCSRSRCSTPRSSAPSRCRCRPPTRIGDVLSAASTRCTAG